MSGQHFGGLFASLNTSNLLKERTIHTSCLGVHKSAKFVLALLLVRSCRLNRTGSLLLTHLIHEELLISFNFLFECLAGLLILNFTFFGKHVLRVNERFVHALLYISLHSTFANLCSQHLVKLFMLLTILILLINVLKACFFVFVEALLDVFLLLFQLKFSTVITNDISHAIHDSLNTSTSLSHFLFPCNFFLTYHAHVSLDLVSVGLLLLF